ncbi:MAG: Mov34/MPN/PAD-1 family protein [Candidatus Freyarchaeota archaeon]|nr:Mov34/MPN/PAD-1 family protein [Candidatus Jordarchaeia archaeon]
MNFLRRGQKRLSAVKIKRELAEGLLEVSKEVYPKEFIGLLRAKEGVISEVVIPPFSVYGLGESSFSPYSLPVDFSIVGSVHSHPSGDPHPSKQDVNVAFSFGVVHLIITYPYAGFEDIYAYDKDGTPLKLLIVE